MQHSSNASWLYQCRRVSFDLMQNLNPWTNWQHCQGWLILVQILMHISSLMKYNVLLLVFIFFSILVKSLDFFGQKWISRRETYQWVCLRVKRQKVKLLCFRKYQNLSLIGFHTGNSLQNFLPYPCFCLLENFCRLPCLSTVRCSVGLMLHEDCLSLLLGHRWI